MCSKQQDNPDYSALLHAYLDICNHSLKGQEGSVARDILSAALSGSEGQAVRFLLRDDRPKAMLDLDIDQDKLVVSEAQQKPVSCEAQKWVFDYSYLQTVVDNRDLYIKEPERLDWSWLYMLAKADEQA
ncbi:MAG: hypothetical protein OIF58_11730 [Cohaesibacter sp.]|nr:hypothetical protein [Cohaesibacter sp.]